jgi:hypothetical protein
VNIVGQIRAIRTAAVWSLAAMFFSGIATAQFRAGLQGTVLDESGAAVPDATVTLTSQETQAKQVTQSGGDGFYRFSQLGPGRYTLSAEATGFQKAVRENVEVTAESVAGLDISLVPGAVTESVTVSEANLPQLETENANIDGTVTRTDVVELPQVGRDPYELIRTQPGVFGQGARDASGGSAGPPNSNCGPCGSNSSIFQTENVVPVSANGQRVTTNTYEIDGVNVNSQTWGGGAVITPSQETVKEIRVVANSYTAETRSGGVNVQVVSQNGTNEWHGSGLFKYDSPSLNAYQRWGGPHGELPQKDTRIFRQYAASLGGPIIKNHVFFYFGYETLRQSSNQLGSAWVETPQFVSLAQSARPNGIASQIVGAPGSTPRIANVLNGTCAQLGLDASSCQVVSGGLDVGSPTGAPGQTVPNAVGGGLDGIPDLQYVQVTQPSSVTGEQYFGRVDWQVRQNDRITFSEYYVPFDSTFASGPASRPNLEWHSARVNLNGALVWNHTFSGTMLNEARFNVTRWNFNELQQNPQIPWGIPQTTVNYNGNNVQWGAGGPGIFFETTYDFRDTLSKVINTHALRFGVEVTKEQNNDTVAWAARPSYDFGNLWNFVNDAPIDETGNFDPRNGYPTDLKKYIRTSIYSWFVQDDWKVTPKLTLNLGLRWDYYTPIREKYGNIANVLLGPGPSPLQGAAMKIGGDLWKPDRNNFAPQLGFAYSPGSVMGHDLGNRVVVRGGFGVGYNRVPESELLNARLNPPYFVSPFLTGSQVVYSLSTSGVNSFYGWPSNPSTIQVFDPNTNFPIGGPGLAKPNVFGVPQKFPQPYVFRYSFQIQYELGHNWVTSVGYQGSAGHKFEREMPYNLIYPANTAINSFTFLQNDVNQNFNALLVTATHRFASNFSVEAQYRFAKSIDTGCSTDQSCPQPWPFDMKLERGVSDYDVTHYMTIAAVWQLPGYRQSHSWMQTILGGWELSGILTANSGYPWSPKYNDQSCVTISGFGGLCPVLPIAYFGGAGTDTSNDTLMREFGNFPGGPSKYFLAPPGGTVLVPPPPGIGRNVFRGPRYFDIDMSVVKRFTLPKMRFFGEGPGLEFRANAFNLFNKLNLKNFQYYDSSTMINSPDFGRATGALGGRVVELQARFSF